MKLFNLNVDGAIHLAVDTKAGLVDLTANGFAYDMDAVIAGAAGAEEILACAASAPIVARPVIANVVNRPNKLLCVGLNYRAHADGLNQEVCECPTLFSKFANALTHSGAPVTLPAWEDSYDYEAELVIVIGKPAWNVSVEEAENYIFGYTCGNDISLRRAQKATTQWLIGKTMPGFGPCGPCIVTKDSYDPKQPMAVRSYVNGELKQDGRTTQMIFPCAEIVSFASRYIALEPGDLIFTGTPTGVALEKDASVRRWVRPGDTVDIQLEGIGTLTNTFVG